MIAGTAQTGRGDAVDAIAALARVEGTAAHPFATRLATSAAAARDLADAVHAVCALHGGYPGVIDHALVRDALPGARDWLEHAADRFAVERTRVTRLAAAAGPLPSTPGQAETESTIIAQRHALEMLARSDRGGCALGAAAALLSDWAAIRGVLDRAALRFGVDPLRLETAPMPKLVEHGPGVERAMLFGAGQLLAQHRGLWCLLEARAAARDRS